MAGDRCVCSGRAAVRGAVKAGVFSRLVALCVAMFCGLMAEQLHWEPRFPDVLFQRRTTILNRTVTCGGHTWGVFSARTYTCDDIQVDGLRLAYGYYPGMEVGDKRCQETKGRQELGRLCRHLLQHVQKRHRGFYGVFVNNATCRYTAQHRYLLVKNTRHSHKWILMAPGHGWLSSISCMVRS